MDPNAHAMSDYSMGDPFGYYASSSAPGHPGQPGHPIGPSQGPLGSSMMMPGGPGGPGYPHQPQSQSSRYSVGSGDPSKGIPSQYPYGSPAAPSQPSQIMSSRVGSYGQSDSRSFSAMGDYPSHLTLGGPQSSSLSSAPGYSSRLIPSYPDQRLPGPSSRSTPVHPVAGHPGYSGYPGPSPGYPPDPWGPGSQARGSFPGYPPSSGPPRSQTQFAGSDQYGLRPPYFSSAPPSAGHIPPDPYSHSGPYGAPGRSSSSQRQQSQYSSFNPLQPPSLPPPSAANSAPSVRYSQQYYGQTSASSYPDPASQPRPSYDRSYPVAPSVSSQMSPRRPTPTPPAGSPMPPTSRTPDRVTTAGTASLSLSGYSNSNSSPLQSGSSQGTGNSSSSGQPSNSLAQLEQMVGSNTMSSSSNSGSKTSTSSAATSASANSTYYSHQSGQPPVPPTNASQSVPYSHFPPPSSSVQPSQQSNSYYPSYQSTQNAAPGNWSGSQSSTLPPPLVGSSGNNAHQGPPSASSSVAYSPASQPNLKSPQAPSIGQNIKSPMTSGQFSMYDSSYNSPATSDSMPGSVMPSMSSKTNQYESSSFGSPLTQNKSDDAKSDSSKMSKEDRRKPDDFPGQESSRTQASPGYFGIRSVSTENSTSSMSPSEQSMGNLMKSSSQGSSSQDQNYISRQSSQSYDPQSSYMNSQQGYSTGQESFPPQSMSQPQFSNNYGESMNYDMQPMGEMGSYPPPHESRIYDPNYSGPGMEGMPGPMGEYPGEMGGPMGSYGSGPSPYDEPFSSEPPGPKRKGKGRPKKDPADKPPKEPKKPRQPKTPRPPRGRGRGAKANMGDRMPPPGSQEPFGDGCYGMPPDMYPPTHPMAPPHMAQMPPPAPGMGHMSMPPHLNPHDPYQSSMMPPSMHPMHSNSISPVDASSLPPPMSTQMPSMSPMSSYDPVNSYGSNSMLPPPPPQQMTHVQPEVTPEVSKIGESQESQMQLSQNVSQPEETAPVSEETELPKKETSEVPKPAESGLNDISRVDEPIQSEFFGHSTNSTDVSSQDSSSIVTDSENLPADQPSVPPCPIVAPAAEAMCVDQQLTEPFVPSEEFPTVSETPAAPKRKGKKRKSKVIDETTGEPVEDVIEKPPKEKKEKTPKEKKPKRPPGPKKPRKKANGVEEPIIAPAEMDQSLTVPESATDTTIDSSAVDLDSTIASVVEPDEGSQEENSQLDSSAAESGGKGKSKKSKGTPKVKKPKLKDGTSGKKRLPKIALAKFKGRKKKKLGSDDNASDIEKTPPPSPDEAESGIQKRRSGRLVKRTKYLDEVDIDLSGDESKVKDDVPVATITIDDTMVVEKIMLCRQGTRELEAENEEEEAAFNGKAPTVEVEEFYVKFKGLSYLHCDWRTEEELERGDKRINQKIKRFRQKKDTCVTDFLDDEPFNPDYCEVDRILDVNIVEEIIPEPLPSNKPVEESKKVDVQKVEDESETKPDDKSDEKTEEKSEITTPTDEVKESKNEELHKSEDNEAKNTSEETELKEQIEQEKAEELENDKPLEPEAKEEEEAPQPVVEVKKPKTRTVKHYLVKWQALSYEECTWENENDLDPIKIQNFWRFREPPPKEKIRFKKKPKPSEWKKLDASPIYKNGNTLREYQLEGLNWLTFCWYNGRNCILADEMGLGKTIQSLAVINEMVKYGIHAPYLIIVPLSTIGNWQREFETWTDLNVITYHGSSAGRNMLQEYEMYYKNEKGERIDGVYKFQVMITTFEVVLTDCLELREINWRCCIIDEAHRLKNRNCKLLEGLRLLQMEHRVLLTGTPLQNNVEELFSLLNFLEPQQFASSESFMLEFGELKTEEQVDKLKAILKPMMLRRLKEDVEKSLAPKEETIVEVELTNIQKKYYRAILERNFNFLSKGGTYANMPNLMNIMMELRKCCIHPFLINSAEEQIYHDYRDRHGDSSDSQLKCMVQASGKLVLIDKLLPRLKADGHRVLIFSQMVRCLDILEDYIVQKKYPYERIDGRVRGNMRQAAIDRYSKPGSDRFVFLLCTRAGGLGINLTAADTVIIFDSDWNPQNDLQAQARCHRIGQSKPVKVYRLICRNTYEREMFDKASLKLGLDKAVLQSMNTGQKVGEGPLSKKDIEDLLRKGAYGAVMDDDNAGDKFCEEDIEQILLRRTQVITIETAEAKGSTFSKASFASSENRSDIDINDPNFWEKWAKKANIEDEVVGRNDLIVEEPRRRTQTKRFGQDNGMMDMSEGDSSDDDEEGISGRTRRSKGGRLGRDKKGRKGKGRFDGDRDEDYLQEFGPGNWTKSECFKVEKGLLTFGFGRWDQMLNSTLFRRPLKPTDVEDVARTILLFCLQNYRGDEKVKSFIWELIVPPEVNGMNDLSPTGKNRKSKKAKKTVAEELSSATWTFSEKYNPDLLLLDDSYRKHLMRQANRLLLRVKNLFYLKTEVIGDCCDDVDKGAPARDIAIPPIAADGEPPTTWWDEECDRSLMIGVFKHGYDRYNLMRQDPALCFLSRCGPPDGAALLAEIQDDEMGKLDEDDEAEAPATPATPAKEEQPKETKDGEESTSETPAEPTAEALIFPSRADMNQRLRRLLTAHQRQFRRQEIRMAQQARHQQRLEKLEKFEAQIKEREIKKREQAQRKWSRREEADFYRVVSSYGVEFDRKTQHYEWNVFKNLSRLEKKTDETVTEYFKAFYAMCKRVTGRALTSEEENLLLTVDPVSEDRAIRCLARIDLLSKIREEIIPSPELDEKLTLCQPSVELPDWWICGKHDKDLLLGAGKYGLLKLDYNLMHDPDLSFKDIVKQAEAEATAILKAETDAINLKSEVDAEVSLLMTKLLDQVVEESNLIKSTPKLEIQEDSTVQNGVSLDDHTQENGIDKSELVNGDSREISNGKNDEDSEKKILEVKAESAISNSALTTPVGPIIPQIKAVKWPKDRALQMRLEQLVYMFEKNEWPSMRHQFFSNLTTPMSSTPSIMTADSSPRALSPGSLSSMSREPTPHPTPDNTPRREPLSPLPEYLFDHSDDPARKRKRRRRRYDAPMPPTVPVQAEPRVQDRQSSKLQAESLARFGDKGFAAKLRNLLSQNIEQQAQQMHQQHHFPQHQQHSSHSSSSGRDKKGSSSQSLLSQASSFLPPLFANLPFMNLREDIRNELLGNEKTASLLLGGLSSRMQQQAASALKQSLAQSSSHGASGPPPAHQNSSNRRSQNMDTLDLSRFKGITPPAPAHKTPKIQPPPPKEQTKPTPASVLDLSSLPTKRSTRHSAGAPSQSPGSQPSSSKESRKRIGSRIDALALNLQAKKMMEEKPSDSNESNFLAEIAQKSESRKSTSSLDMLLGARSSRSSGHGKSSSSTPPAAHSSASPSSKLTDALFGKSSRSSSSASGLAMLDASKLLRGQTGLDGQVDQAAALQSFKTLSQDLKKWLEDHPEFVAANPSLAAAAAAAMALNPPMTSSSLPANTELLELPESRRRGRRQKPENKGLESQGLTGEENVSVVNRVSGRRISGPKAPPLKHLTEWLDKNPNYEVDPKWSPLTRDKFDFKTPAAVAPSTERTSTHSGGVRTRTSDRSSRSSSSSGDGHSSQNSSSSSSRRTTAASLLAQAHGGQSGSSKSSSGSSSSSSSFGFPSSSLNPMNFNPSLLASLSPSMKMFMDSAAASSPSATSSSKTSSTSTSTTSTSSSSNNLNSMNPFGFPFGGLANMNLPNSLFGFPNFNLQGFPGAGQIPGFPGSETETKKTKESSSSERSSSRSSEKNREKSKNGGSSSSSMSSAERNAAAAAASLFGSGAGSSLPFLYPNPNFLYPGLGALGGLSMPGSSSPFASLAQSGLMNGLSGLSSAGLSPASSSSSKHGSKDRDKSSKSSSRSSSGAPSGLSLSTASSLLSSTGLHPSSAAAAAAMGDSDDESLKSLMGHDDDDDLNGEAEEQAPEKDDDSDYEVSAKKRSSRSTRTSVRDSGRSGSSRRSTQNSSKSKN